MTWIYEEDIDILPLDEKLKLTSHPGMLNLLSNYRLRAGKNQHIPKINVLNQDGLNLIEWCIDFLIYQRDFQTDFPKKDQNQIHKNKYITIWSFVYGFLGIEKDSGLDHWLLWLLSRLKILEYGCANRSGWFNTCDTNPYLNRTLSTERHDIILEWAKSAPDEI